MTTFMYFANLMDLCLELSDFTYGFCEKVYITNFFEKGIVLEEEMFVSYIN